MTKGRIEAFSDGVIAIIITIMVLELRAPEDHTIDGLIEVLPVFLTYILSFINVGIYWTNHHHMFHAVQKVSGRVLWANLHLMFWLSLVPFTTAFMDESLFLPMPVAFYSFNLAMCAVAYALLTLSLVAIHGAGSDFARAVRSGWKEKASLAAYLLAIPAAFVSVWISGALIVAVTLAWIVPDRRFRPAA